MSFIWVSQGWQEPENLGCLLLLSQGAKLEVEHLMLEWVLVWDSAWELHFATPSYYLIIVCV